MSEPFYSNWEVQQTCQSQRMETFVIPRRNSLSGFRCPDCPVPSFSWKTIAVILGIICLLLLLSIGLLVKMWNIKLYDTEDYLGNLSFTGKANKIVGKCRNNWHQYGENCYYFAREMLPWKECQRYCSVSKSLFLKSNTEEEMNFVKKLSIMQCDMQNEKFWISLYYDSKQFKWVWFDGTDLILDKPQFPGHENANNKCICIKYGQMVAEDCRNSGYCICKKTSY